MWGHFHNLMQAAIWRAHCDRPQPCMQHSEEWHCCRVHHKDDCNLALIVSWALLKCFENPNCQFSWTSHSFRGSDMPPCTEMRRHLG